MVRNHTFFTPFTITSILVVISSFQGITFSMQNEDHIEELFQGAYELQEAGKLDAALEQYISMLSYNYAPALCNMGLIYQKKSVAAVDREEKETYFGKALKMFLCAAEQGDDIAQFNVGCLFIQKFDKSNDFEQKMACLKQAEVWTQKAAGQGHVGARSNLGALRLRRAQQTIHTGMRTAQFLKAQELFKAAAQQGGREAQLNLYIYTLGQDAQGEEELVFQAEQCLLEEARAGNALAANNLSYFYRKRSEKASELGERKALIEKALEYGLKGVQNNNCEAQHNIALAYHAKYELTTEAGLKEWCLEQSLIWSLKASTQNYLWAHYWLALLYKEKVQRALSEVEKDTNIKLSLHYLKLAAEQDSLTRQKSEVKFCARCGIEGKKACTGCMLVHYCSKECQSGHWPAHKLACRKAP